MNADFADVLPEYIEESRDILTRLRSSLSRTAPEDIAELIDELFRGIHTIKGGAAMLELERLTKRAHALETRLTSIRDGSKQADATLQDDIQFEIDWFEYALDMAPEEPAEETSMEFDSGDDVVAPEAEEVTDEELEESTKSTDEPAPAPFLEKLAKKDKVEKQLPTAPSEMLRVPLELVNSTLNQIWELFLVRNQLTAMFESNRDKLKADADLWQTWERIDSALRRNVTELESGVMAMRMNSMQGLFSRMEATARKYARDHPEKDLDFVMEGIDVEADKKVLDTLAQPLVHLIRNSLDHGIEPWEERLAKKKSRAGTIYLSAELGTDNIFLKVRDTGRGIDPSMIVQHAMQHGFDTSRIENKNDAYELMFLPGFSTASEVTETSGRGVGLDAVRRSVDELGGTIEIDSTFNEGTTFTIALPLSLSVIDAIMFEVNGQSFGCSVGPVVEVLKLGPGGLDTSRGTMNVKYRGSYFPCVDLEELLADPFEHVAAKKKRREEGEEEEIWVIVTQARRGVVGFRVSRIIGNTEIIVKPVPRYAPKPRFVNGVSLRPTGEPFFVIALDKLREPDVRAPRPEAAA